MGMAFSGLAQVASTETFKAVGHGGDSEALGSTASGKVDSRFT